MNFKFTTDNLNIQPTPHGNSTSDEGVDLSKLGIKFAKTEDSGSVVNVIDSPEDIIELENFCKLHGIIPMGIGNLSAKETLNKLKESLYK